ncbi:cytochrome p450 monooxygenase [Grosmannia clavigera kw1407]|uniref:Cytochrome p450 monooxygenase n=1 Tax=Grosmannia clavigera (strain kw1407 / UAMH 11150) TaxID=655863 RepID=F0XDX2_GROCL|nr:cytochrome p450 monooxygenase [Grosmannia clavigera kw1407]EFX04018.1 cytochrome p450 monooxygenase [Grosmannia clavigera kw1407]
MGLSDGPRLLYAAAAILLALVLRSVFSTPVLRRHGVPLRKPADTLPLAGNGIRFLQARQKLFSWFVRCQDHFGYETYQIAVPTLPPGVVISDPRNLDFIFKSEGTLVNKGSFVKGMLWDLFGHGIVNSDGDVWRVQRRAGQSFLNTANIRVLTDVALPQYLAGTLARLRALDTTAAVDLQAVFHELTSCIMGKMAYNMEMHAEDAFSVAFDRASAATTKRFQNPLWQLTDLLSGSGADLRRQLAIVRAFGRRIVASAVADRAAQLDHADNKLDEVSGSLIQSLLEAIPNQDIVADAALNYLSAGRDTVAQGLTWTFYMLTKHPRVVAQIRLEIEQLLASSNNSLTLSALTPAALPYVMAVFFEGLRLYPPIPFEIKQVETAAGLTLPDGTFLPCGALVLWCSWAMNRSRQTWGDDADDFRPERWLVETPHEQARLVGRSPSEFPVFHGGPRTCLGKKMAESMAVQIMAAVVWHFDVQPDSSSSPDRVTKTSLTLPMNDGLPCIVRERAVSMVIAA